MTEKQEKYELETIEDKDIQVYQPGPMEMAQTFLSNGGNIENLKEMMALQKEHDAYQAKKAFVVAMSKFKEEPIIIAKDKDNKQYNSKYSSIGAIVNSCLPRMGKFGLSHKWEFDPQTDQKFLTGYCVVIHSAGHSDSVSMTAPIDTSGSKNPIQQIKSTRTYIKIETFASLMGLASSEDLDDDGNASSYINKDQIKTITDKIKETGSDKKAFLEYLGVESIAQIQARNYGRVLISLKLKEKKTKTLKDQDKKVDKPTETNQG